MGSGCSKETEVRGGDGRTSADTRANTADATAKPPVPRKRSTSGSHCHGVSDKTQKYVETAASSDSTTTTAQPAARPDASSLVAELSDPCATDQFLAASRSLQSLRWLNDYTLQEQQLGAAVRDASRVVEAIIVCVQRPSFSTAGPVVVLAALELLTVCLLVLISNKDQVALAEKHKQEYGVVLEKLGAFFENAPNQYAGLGPHLCFRLTCSQASLLLLDDFHTTDWMAHGINVAKTVAAFFQLSNDSGAGALAADLAGFVHAKLKLKWTDAWHKNMLGIWLQAAALQPATISLDAVRRIQKEYGRPSLTSTLRLNWAVPVAYMELLYDALKTVASPQCPLSKEDKDALFYQILFGSSTADASSSATAASSRTSDSSKASDVPLLCPGLIANASFRRMLWRGDWRIREKVVYVCVLLIPQAELYPEFVIVAARDVLLQCKLTEKHESVLATLQAAQHLQLVHTALNSSWQRNKSNVELMLEEQKASLQSLHKLVQNGGGTVEQKEQLAQCTQDFTLLSARLTDLASTLDEVRDSVQQVLGKAAVIQQLIEQQTAAIVAVDQRVASVGSSVQEVKHVVKDLHRILAEQKQQEQDEKRAEAAQLQTLVRDRLAQIYSIDDKIVSIFGPAMELDGDFINLQILHHVKLKQPDKGESASGSAATSSGQGQKAPVHMSSYDDLFGDKRTLVLADLFTPNSKLFKQDELDPKDGTFNAAPPQFVLVQGRAGIGKTTLVRHVVREWAQRRVLHDSFDWVFLLRLRELNSATFLAHKSLSLPEWIYTSLLEDSDEISLAAFEQVWTQHIKPAGRRVLFLLDGFDELPEQHCCSTILSKMAETQFTWLITSRPLETDVLPSKRRNLEILGFTDDNIQKYVEHFFSSHEGAPLPSGNAAVAHCLRALHAHPTIWSCAHIPISLNIICAVTVAPSDLDADAASVELGTMTALYRAMELKLCERSYRAERDKLTDAARASMMPLPRITTLREQTFQRHFEKQQRFLEHLAFHSFVQQRLIIPCSLVDSILEQLCVDDIKSYGDGNFMATVLAHGILKPVTDKGSGTTDWEFLHLSFQEYFVAKHIALRLQQGAAERLHQGAGQAAAASVSSSSSDPALIVTSIILHHKLNPRWQIVWWFVAGMSSGPSQQHFLALLQGHVVASGNIAAGPPPARDLFEQTELALLSRCVEEGHGALEQKCPELIDSVTERLQRLLLRHHESQTKFSGMEVFVKTLRMNSWLNQQDGSRDLFRQIPETPESYISFVSVVQIAFPVVQARIRQLVDSRQWKERRCAVSTIGALGGSAPPFLSALVALLSDKNYDVHRSAFRAVRSMGAAAATESFLCALAALMSDKDSFVRCSAAEAVGSMGAAAATESILSALAALLSDKDCDVCRSAADAVGSLGAAAATESIHSALAALLSDEDSDVRCSAAGAVRSMGAAAATESILSALAALLSDKDSYVRRCAQGCIVSVVIPGFLSVLSRSLGPSAPVSAMHSSSSGSIMLHLFRDFHLPVSCQLLWCSPVSLLPCPGSTGRASGAVLCKKTAAPGSKSAGYVLSGFVGRQRFHIACTPEQVQWLRHVLGVPLTDDPRTRRRLLRKIRLGPIDEDPLMQDCRLPAWHGCELCQ